MWAALPFRRFRIVFVAQGAIERASVEVIDVAAIGAAGKSISQASLDEPVEELADVLAVLNACEGLVLAPEAIPAMQRDRREEPRVARGESKSLQSRDALVGGHASRSKW